MKTENMLTHNGNNEKKVRKYSVEPKIRQLEALPGSARRHRHKAHINSMAYITQQNYRRGSVRNEHI